MKCSLLQYLLSIVTYLCKHCLVILTEELLILLVSYLIEVLAQEPPIILLVLCRLSSMHSRRRYWLSILRSIFARNVFHTNASHLLRSHLPLHNKCDKPVFSSFMTWTTTDVLPSNKACDLPVNRNSSF
jgi:hypothetical protein